MKKTQILAGAIVIFILSRWMGGVAIDLYEDDLFKDILPLSFLSERTLTIIGVVETIFLLTLMTWIFVDYARKKPKMINLSPRFDVKVFIPGPFFAALLPVAMGLVFAVFGQPLWGIFLQCLSLPYLIGLLIVALGKKDQK